jgi:hypothetical protein
VAGPGGFAGGPGGDLNFPAKAGFGPASGQPAPQPITARGGGFGGNSFLVPLFGGSGGGGGVGAAAGSWGAGGGAGGGAILIASTVGIIVNGTIRADGGAGVNSTNCTLASGGGGGGAIRLAAPVISGNGVFSAAGGVGGSCGGAGGGGRVRLEAFENRYAGTSQFTQGAPVATHVTTTGPTLRVLSVAGHPVSSTPTGSFTLPDVQIDASAAVPVVIEALNVPTGTIVELHLYSDTGVDQVVQSPPLTGSAAQSSATAMVVFAPGFTRGFPRAVW